MAAFATLGHGDVPGGLPGSANSTGLCVAAVAFVRSAREYAVDMTPFSFNQAVGAFESKPGSKVIERWRGFRA